MKSLWRERTVHVAILSLTLIITTAALRRPLIAGVEPENYWAAKLDWHAQVDCVLAGDSRVAYALAPHVIEACLDDARVLNFAFDTAGFSTDYLDAIEAVVDPASNSPTIVLGITPHSLTGHAMQLSDYSRRRAGTGNHSAVGLALSRWLHPWQPMRLDTMGRELDVLGTSQPVLTYHDDGWLAFAPPSDSRAQQLRWYEYAFAEGPVDGAVVDGLLARVRRWVASGVVVHAFRPPTCRVMLELEQRLGQFDEQEFVRRFEAVGGHWLQVDPLAYHCADGSHLHSEAALRLSEEVARTLRATREARHAAAGQ